MAKKTADTRRIKWHPGFWGGIELELSSYRDVLIFEPEHQLSKEPLRMDMLIIRKDPAAVIEDGIVRIPVQIVITGRLSREHPALRMLSRQAEKEDLRGFIRQTAEWATPGDRNNISAVLQVAGAANRELFNVLRKEQDMPEVFKEIFKEDLESAEARGIALGETRGETRGALKQSIRMYKNCLARGMSEEDARALSELPEDIDPDHL